MEEGQLWRQYVIAGIANIAISATGYCMGWTSPVNIKLQDPATSPLPEVPTSDQLAWIGSLLLIGAIIGSFAGGFVAATIGRRWALLISSLPMLVGWILVDTATDVIMIYIARVFWGTGLGMLFTITPMYCAEIATDDRRGAIGSFMSVFLTIGYLLVYSIGPYVSYNVISYVGASCVLLFCVTFFFMPESPIYYLSKNDNLSAAKSLSVIRGRCLRGVQPELKKMSGEVELSMTRTAKFADLFRGTNFRAFYISCALLIFQQIAGISPVLFYLTTIFEASGTYLDPAISTIIIGVVQVAACSMTPFVADYLGRKTLLMISSCGSALSLTLLGTYFILDENDSPVIAKLEFLPILSLVLFILTYCWGLSGLPWVVMAEILPIEVKAMAATIATALGLTSAFLVSRFFFPIAEAVGMGVAFFIFVGFCTIAFFFTLFLVPETKGKSFQEIQDLLVGKMASQNIS